MHPLLAAPTAGLTSQLMRGTQQQGPRNQQQQQQQQPQQHYRHCHHPQPQQLLLPGRPCGSRWTQHGQQRLSNEAWRLPKQVRSWASFAACCRRACALLASMVMALVLLLPRHI